MTSATLDNMQVELGDQAETPADFWPKFCARVASEMQGGAALDGFDPSAMPSFLAMSMMYSSISKVASASALTGVIGHDQWPFELQHQAQDGTKARTWRAFRSTAPSRRRRSRRFRRPADRPTLLRHAAAGRVHDLGLNPIAGQNHAQAAMPISGLLKLPKQVA